ncbi:MAG: squalene synthase HpnC [Pseudomonadota bacterium]
MENIKTHAKNWIAMSVKAMFVKEVSATERSAEQLKSAYIHCQKIAQQHYENFPVASRFLPKKLRQPICVIYAFARTADDFADEGDLETSKRLLLLQDYHQQLEQISNHSTNSKQAIFIALADVIRNFKLPIILFHNLLEAFEQDAVQTQYQNHQQLLDYCKKSASPIGQLMLYLHNQASTENLDYSDNICSALQLINFLQDMQQDALESKRLYIPLEDIHNLNIDPQQLIKQIASGQDYNESEALLIKQQIHQAEQLLLAGTPLIRQLSGRFQFEIALIVNSGIKIIHKLKQANDFSYRPRLNRLDKITILFKTIQSIHSS